MCNVNFNSGPHGFKPLKNKNKKIAEKRCLDFITFDTVKSLKTVTMTKQDCSYQAVMSLNGKV